MGGLLKVAGFGWAILGLINLTGIADIQSAGMRDQLITFAIQYNMLVHILPGLLVGGLGHMISQGAAKRKAADASREDEA